MERNYFFFFLDADELDSLESSTVINCYQIPNDLYVFSVTLSHRRLGECLARRDATIAVITIIATFFATKNQNLRM